MQLCLFFLVVFLRLHATGPFPIRLSGGPNLCVGRVELFHQGEWGTVCDDDWDLRDVAVVCRELDCGDALSAPHGAWFGEGAGPIWLNEVRCAGTEWQLHSCRHLGFRKHVCTHEEDASAICSEQRFPPFTAFPPHTTFRRGEMEAVPTTRPLAFPTPAEGTPALRLVGGRSHCSGRLEVYHEGQWGTVCDDMWDLLDVAVVCRELDCGEALAAPGGAFFGEGNSVIWLDDVQCQGEESVLVECHTSPWGTNNCRHSEDAGAVCSGEMPLAMVEERVAMLTRTLAPQRPRSAAPKRIPRPQPTRDHEEPAASEASHTDNNRNESLSEGELNGQWQVRLAGGPGSCAGRVEVLYKGHWGTVCDDGWDLVDAAVVCRELGCGAPLLSPGNARYGPGSGPIWLDDVNCTGAEFTLRRCRSQPWGKHNCNHHEDASVICTGKWKRLSLPKPSSDPKIAETTTTTTQDPRPADKPGLQSTLDVAETTTATQGFPTEWEMESLNTWHSGALLQPTQNAGLEAENETKPISILDRVETTPYPEILQHVQEARSTSPPKTRSTTHEWEQESPSLTAESQPSSAVWDLETESETEPTTHGDMATPMPNPEILQHVQDMVTTSPPKTRSTTHTWEQEPTYPSVEPQPSSAMWDLESERETEPTTPGDMATPMPNPEILQHVQDMVTTSPPKTRSATHTWEQEPTYPSVEPQPSSAMWDLESERETEPPTLGDMATPMPNPEILQHVQDMVSTSPPKTRSTTHTWEQQPTYPSTEFQLPSAMQDLKFEGETEPTSPSGTDLPIVSQSLKPATEMSEIPPVTENVEPSKTSAGAQPATVTWVLEPDMEATSHSIQEPFLLSKNLEATREMELPTAEHGVLSINHMETTDPKIPESEENIVASDSTFPLADLSSLDGTDVHNTTELPPSPVSHPVSTDGQFENDLVNSGDTGSGTIYADTTSTPGLSEAPGPNVPSAEAATLTASLGKPFSGCPLKQEPRKEDQGCCCSPPALGNLAHAVEGLHGELGSLSTTIRHQGSQLEAVARSLAELAASVHHLVRVLPGLLQPVPAQSAAPCRQDEGQSQNQLPLK